MISTALRMLARLSMPTIGASIFLGLLFPGLAAFVRPAMEPLVVLLLTAAILQLDWSAALTFGRRPLLALSIVAWLLVASPILVWAGGTALGLAPMLLAAIVLNASSAPIISSVPFCQLLSLNAELAVFAVVTGTLLLPVTLAPVIFLLLGVDIAIDLQDFALRTGIFIVLPFIVAAVLRRIIGADIRAAYRRDVDGLTVLFLVIIAIAIMDGVSARVLADPVKAATITLAAFAVSATLHVIGGALFWRMGARAGLAMAVTSGSRNLILLLVVLGEAAGDTFTLYVALGQLPIYLMPTAIQPVCRALLRRANRRTA
jgi:BASS family bile acid:Na+ symporter